MKQPRKPNQRDRYGPPIRKVNAEYVLANPNTLYTFAGLGHGSRSKC
jgi:hypothetical protein